MDDHRAVRGEERRDLLLGAPRDRPKTGDVKSGQEPMGNGRQLGVLRESQVVAVEGGAVGQISLGGDVGFRRADLGLAGRQLFLARHGLQLGQLRLGRRQVGLVDLELRQELPVIDAEERIACLHTLADLIHRDKDFEDHAGERRADGDVFADRLGDAGAGHGAAEGRARRLHGRGRLRRRLLGAHDVEDRKTQHCCGQQGQQVLAQFALH